MDIYMLPNVLVLILHCNFSCLVRWFKFQGFWNFLIFLERRKMKTKVGGCLKSIFCCCPSLVQWCKRRRETRHGLATSENDGLYDESSSEEDEEEEEEEETNKVEVAVEDIRELEEEKDEEPSDPLATLD